MQAKFKQFFGEFSGTFVNENGETVSFDKIYGFAEVHRAKWWINQLQLCWILSYLSSIYVNVLIIKTVFFNFKTPLKYLSLGFSNIFSFLALNHLVCFRTVYNKNNNKPIICSKDKFLLFIFIIGSIWVFNLFSWFNALYSLDSL